MISPKRIYRNCNLIVNGSPQLGQIKEVEIPELNVETHDHRPCGTQLQFEVAQGYSKLELSFKGCAIYDRVLFQDWGGLPGKLANYIIATALVDEDGTTHQMLCSIHGFLKTISTSSMSAGEEVTNDYKVSVRHITLEEDKTPLLKLTPTQCVVSGVDLTKEQNDALLIGF